MLQLINPRSACPQATQPESWSLGPAHSQRKMSGFGPIPLSTRNIVVSELGPILSDMRSPRGSTTLTQKHV